MLLELLHESVLSGESRMVLEVIQKNAAAVALYESEGFHRTRELLGFSRNSGDMLLDQSVSSNQIIDPVG